MGSWHENVTIAEKYTLQIHSSIRQLVLILKVYIFKNETKTPGEGVATMFFLCHLSIVHSNKLGLLGPRAQYFFALGQ